MGNNTMKMVSKEVLVGIFSDRKTLNINPPTKELHLGRLLKFICGLRRTYCKCPS